MKVRAPTCVLCPCRHVDLGAASSILLGDPTISRHARGSVAADSAMDALNSHSDTVAEMATEHQLAMERLQLEFVAQALQRQDALREELQEQEAAVAAAPLFCALSSESRHAG